MESLPKCNNPYLLESDFSRHICLSVIIYVAVVVTACDCEVHVPFF